MVRNLPINQPTNHVENEFNNNGSIFDNYGFTLRKNCSESLLRYERADREKFNPAIQRFITRLISSGFHLSVVKPKPK